MSDQKKLHVPLMFALVLLLSIPLYAAPPEKGGKGGDGSGGGKPGSDLPPVNTEIEVNRVDEVTGAEEPWRLSGDGLGAYIDQVDGVRSVFGDDNLLLGLSHYAPSSRTARLDLNLPADGTPLNPQGHPLGISQNNTLLMNIRSQIAQIEPGTCNDQVHAQFSIESDVDGKLYQVVFSGSNETDWATACRSADGNAWTVEAVSGKKARVWDRTKWNRSVLMGLYYMDFRLTITLP